ncbi:MAG: hypothetical protein ACE5GW_10940, partial [Planctomycetota bacterium]
AGSPLDLYLAARLHQEGGHPARALGLYELVLAAPHARAPVRPGARLAAVRLYLEGGWPERARQMAAEGGLPDLPRADRLRLDFRLAAAPGAPPGEARRILFEEAREISVDERAGWARAAGLGRLAAELLEVSGEDAAALREWLLAGDWRRAGELHERGVRAGDEDTAFELSRALGDPGPLERVLELREDPRAVTLRDRLWRSLGRGAPEDSRARGERTDADALEAGGPARAGTPSGGHAAADPRVTAALEIERSGGSPPAGATALLMEAGPPSLVGAAAFLTLERTREARGELTRWRLEPREEERGRWLPVLARRRPEWFPGRTDPAAITVRAEGAREGDRELEALLTRALGGCDPGSGREAEILFHRGRLAGRGDDLRRAAAIAPQMRVAYPGEGFRIERPAGDAVARLGGEEREAPPGSSIPIPAPPDAPLGVDGERILRLGREGSHPWWRADAERWRLLDWEEDPDPEPARALVGIDWNESGARLPRGEWVGAGGMAPLTGGARVPGGWLLVGRGLLLLGGDPPHERLRLTAEDPWHVGALPAAALRELAPEVARRIDHLGPPDPAEIDGVPAFREFLAGARLRQGDPALAVSSRLPLLRGGEVTGALLRAGPLRARFDPSEAPPAERKFPGYRQMGEIWLREDLPGPPREHPAAADPPGPHPEAFVLAWRREVELPSRRSPAIEPLGPEEPTPRELPPGLARERVVARAGNDPALLVTSGGHVLYYRTSDPLPQWIASIPVPLPGPLGFPLPAAAAAARAGVTEARGPDRAGGGSSPREPRVHRVEQGFLVTTDEARLFTSGGPAPVPVSSPAGEHPRPERQRELRDATTDDRGRIWLLPAPGDRVAAADGGRELRLPGEGGFDLEVAGGLLFVLGFSKGSFFLVGIDPDKDGATPRSLPLPPLPFLPFLDRR